MATSRRGLSLVPPARVTLAAERQRHIVEAIGRGDILSVADLAQRFGVSQESIRRDIRTLEEGGQLRRVHGGAAPVELTAPPPVADRLDIDRAAKEAIAGAALALFRPGMHVFLGGSSTMLLLARRLAAEGPPLRVATNMVDIALVMAAADGHEVTLLGGELSSATRTLRGGETLAGIRARAFDLAVSGVSAIDPDLGFLGPTAWHAALLQTLAAQALATVFVAAADKFGRRDAHVILSPRPCTVVTERRPDAALTQPLERQGVTLLIPG